MAEDEAQPDESAPAPLTIAGIGASAGGVKALQDFFSALPNDTGAALVVVVHLDPDHHSELSRIIATRTQMPVQQVDKTAKLEPNHVYVIPPNRQLTITDTQVSAREFEEPRGQRAPIDRFFRSLAQHGNGIAIILSGAGSDGALGVRAIREAGGIILVQDPNEAEYGYMPRAAVTEGHADFVLPARELAIQFAELVRRRQVFRQKTDAEINDEILGRILANLRVHTGHDFSQYKRASLMRRLDRRAQVVKAPDFQAYLNYLRDHPEEVQALFADLLISVTRFFRDPAAFEQLERTVVPAILDKKGQYDTIRIWVPGCATGEEAYSLAMIFLDGTVKRDVRPEIQIFATDLDPRALALAREGRYPDTVSADISEERLRRYFTVEGDEYRIRREVRDLVVFAQHSVLKDPPFSRLDLISCRNFLIYINRELQQRVIGTFRYALVEDGYLFLGSSETADTPDNMFRVVDRGARIFQSTGPKPGEKLPLPNFVSGLRVPDLTMQGTVQSERSHAPDGQQQHRQALTELGPPSILVDEHHRILNLSEKAGKYLLHPPGLPTNDITDLVRPELTSELRVLLNRAFQLGDTGMSLPIPVQFNGHSRNVCIQACLVPAQGSSHRALVLFIEGGPTDLSVESAIPESQTTDVQVKRLQDELLATRSNLKVSRQQFDAATENLRAANEELQSINEEYRSTAEELETSREELQSMNEELQTLNSELKSKLDAVSRAHNDLENLMIATDVGTLFLDRDLRIKRFTPRMRELFNINSTDEGRNIGDFTTRMNYPEFENDARGVMKDNRVVKKAVRADGHWYQMQIRPYRTVDGETEGVVTTFMDTTAPAEQPRGANHSPQKRGRSPK